MDTIKLARSAQDISHVVRLTLALRASVDGPQDVDRIHTGAQVARLIQSPTGVVFVSPNGFIAGEVSQTIINPEPIAFEHGWYATDRSGLRLLSAFEKWAADMGCGDRIKMSTSPIEGAAWRILERRGYRPAEMAWSK